MSEFQNYHSYISEQAKDFVDEHKEDVFTEIRDGNTDVYQLLNDDHIHSWVDNDFIYVDLIDSAHIIEQSENVETDWGLWEGQEPIEAIKTQAFFTYRNDLYYAVKDILESEIQDEINNLEGQLDELVEDYNNSEDDDEKEDLDTEIEELKEIITNFELAEGSIL